MKSIKFKENNHLILLAGITIAFVVFAYIISIVKHNQFLSNGWDLGIYNQYMYKFSHFKNPIGSVYARYGEKGVFFLGDHITLLLPFESLFNWFLGQNTLLYFQIFYIVVGAIGLYKLILLETNSKPLSALAYFLVLSHYSAFSALEFDFHTNISGAMLVPWILYYSLNHNLRFFLIATILSLLSKEDSAIILIFLSFFMLLSNSNKKYIYASILFGVSLLYFIICYNIILKSFSPIESGQVSNWRYGHISNSMSGFFSQLINNPGKYLSMMFDTPEKQIKLKYFLYTGGILGLANPKYLLMILPNFIINNLSDTWGTWGNMSHYNILFAIWVPYMTVSFLSTIKYKYITVFLSIISIYSNIYFLRDNYFTDWSRFDKVFHSEYYHQRYNIKEIKEMLNLIPYNASVSASNHLVPHLAFRDKCYYFPEVYNAEYIAIIESDCNDRFYYYPNSSTCYYEINKYKTNSNYKIVYNKNAVLLLKRKE